MKRHNFTFYSLLILFSTFLLTFSSCKKDKKDDGSESPETYDSAYDGLQIYMFGSSNKEGDALGSRTVYCNDGNVNNLEGAENGGKVMSAYLKGKDYYAVGFEGKVGENVSSRTPVYWLIGKKHVIENLFANGNLIYVTN